jgi:phenylacetate-coenzyme A ligase PaaK-like adenylate-forming protein
MIQQDARSQPTLSQYRVEQLVETLKYVGERSTFYQPLVDVGHLTKDNAVSLLKALPVMADEDWRKSRALLRCGSLAGSYLGYTSGTTGTPKVFAYAPEEMQVFNKLFERHETARTLVLSSHAHGPAGLSGFSKNSVPVLLQTLEQHEHAARLLERDEEPFCAFEPIGTIVGSVHLVRSLTLFLLRQRGRVDDLGVRDLVMTRHVLSPRWVDRMESWWDAKVRGLYGFSELRVCNALTCDHCGYYHLPPSCFGEVVDMEDHRVEIGPGQRGCLLVTAFVPFIKIEPRIRYRPGDIVEVAAAKCAYWGERGFRPLGRETDSLKLPNGGWACRGDFLPLLADMPEVACLHNSQVDPLDLRYHEVGTPRFMLSDAERPTLDVELRFDPLVWEREADDVCRRIAESIAFPQLAVVAHGPGSLKDRAANAAG